MNNTALHLDATVPSHGELLPCAMATSCDYLCVFFVSLYLVVIASGVVTAVSKVTLFTYHKVYLGITTLKTPLEKATPTQKPSARSADNAPTVSAAEPAAVLALGAGRAGGETESVGAVDASSGVGESGAAEDHGDSPVLVERKSDAAEGPIADNLGDKSATDSDPRREEHPPVERNNAAGEKSSQADEQLSGGKSVVETSLPTVREEVVEGDAGAGARGTDANSGDEVPPAKLDIEALPSPAAEEIHLSEAATTPEAQPPSPPAVAEGADGPQVTDGSSYTTDDQCGMPPTSTAQALEESTESLGAEASGNEEAELKPSDLARRLGIQGPSICMTGVPTSPAAQATNESPRPRWTRASMKQKFASLFGLRSSSSRWNKDSAGEANDSSPPESGTSNTFSRLANKVQRAARRAASPQVFTTKRGLNEVTLVSELGVKDTFDALRTLLANDELNCHIAHCSKKWSSAYKVRTTFTAMRDARLAVVIANFVVQEQKIGVREGGVVGGKRAKYTVIKIQPSKRDDNVPGSNHYKDFVNMVRVGLSDMNVLLPRGN